MFNYGLPYDPEILFLHSAPNIESVFLRRYYILMFMEALFIVVLWGGKHRLKEAGIYMLQMGKLSRFSVERNKTISERQPVFSLIWRT